MTDTKPIQLLNRWTGRVQFECHASASLTLGERIGFAVKAAFKADADLRHAVLSHADLRGAVLSHAVLSGAVLSGAVLSHAVLSHADLRGAVLSGADLRGAVLSHADLSGADLSGAVLRGAKGIPPIPAVPNIDAAILGEIEAGAGLEMDSWHTCETTHCIAGWAITLAGKEGRDLEAAVGPAAAGALIYAVSNPNAPIPDFYATNEKALADLRKRASRSGAAA